MIKLTQNDWRLFRRLQRKHKVSTEFLRYNLENIEKFIWFETWPRIVIKRYTVRKENRVFIIYYRLRRVLFDQSNRKMLKRMRQNIKQWSKRVVAWQRAHLGIKEYVEEVIYENKSETKQNTVEATAKEKEKPAHNSNEDVSQQLKQQLELLKSGRRPQSLISNVSLEEKPTAAERSAEANKTNKENEEVSEKSSEMENEKQKSDSISVENVSIKLKEQLNNLKTRRETTAPLDIITPIETNEGQNDTNLDKTAAAATTGEDWQLNLESTPEKQITTQENIQPIKQLDTDEKTEKSHNEPNTPQTEKLKTGLNFLDMLICKVSGNSNSRNFSQTNTINSNSTTTKLKESCLGRTSSSNSFKEGYQHHHEHSMDSTDEFLGFDDCERIPGMLMTPIVPHSTKNNKNSVFVSESLNEYMRLNDLETNYSIDEDKTIIKSKIFARDMEGLMTPKTKPPHFDMPAVPENLLKFRTVAERKQYLQKFSKNYRLAIINNEAIIYRELQRRMRTQKVKSASQMLAQSPNSSMSFTRNGWNAASFINTEFNKYYYQKLDVDFGLYNVCLRGARGNNDEFYKTPYVSRVMKPSQDCFDNCADDKIWQYLKPIKTIIPKTKKLNKDPLPSVFKPCPLSHKTFQKPLDDDTAALLLAGGSMAVVRMPTVELEVFPECGKPLHEIAKRYLQYILPHHDISREWAEFSVSTLQQPKSLKEAEQAAAKSFNKEREFRKSYTFVIPYLNDRNHILVRRVVDRSEKLDQSFEKCLEERELVPKTDFQFRQNLDQTDEVLLTCADVVSDMINTVAISCSENSFIKEDPDGLHKEDGEKSTTKTSIKHDSNSLERPMSASPNNVTSSGTVKKQKKQNSLLMELKRLNATIIDAAVKPENDKKPCSKDYCQMGCICVSLEDNVPMREHCGKPKCMLECNCKPSNQSRIMRLETDGRTLTTEDAFMLRRKATARLARMEKEFTSTVVLTENETLLINETNNDKKRRCTKAPKRYEDFTDTEDEQRRNSPKKTALTTIDREKHLAIEIKEVHEPVYVKDTILDQLKHCTVNLVRLPNMDNIAPWCMVHNLYKCFCKGRALEGKPIIIEKEDVNTTIEHDVEPKLELDYNVSVKAKYTFDKVEKKRKFIENDDSEIKDVETVNEGVEDNQNEGKDGDNDNTDTDWIKERKRKKKEKHDKLSEKLINNEALNIESTNSEVELDESLEDEYTRYSPMEQDQTMKHKSKRSLHEVRKRFYQLRYESCRRHIPTPRRMFLYCNRRRRLNVLKFIKENENEQTRLLLNEHIMRSVYYHKIDIENHKKNNHNNSHKPNQKLEDVEETKSDKLTQNSQTNGKSIEQSKNKQMPVEEVVDLLEDEDETSCSNTVIKEKDENTQLTSSSTKSCSSFEKILPDPETSDTTNHFQICSSNGVITVKKFATLTDLKISEQNKQKPMQIPPAASASTSTASKIVNVVETESDEIKLPKISSCFSLNIKANVQKPANTSIQPEKQNLDFTSATSLHSAAFAQSQKLQKPDSFVGASSSCKTSDISSLDVDSESLKDVYNSVIKTMNSLVSKKMQDIDCALQRESHIIPTPNPDILCIMKWCNFLDAFCEGFAYVWQVKIKEATFFVVTIQNIMPLIPGAMGIVNITALKPDKMPLMGKMLLQKFRNKETEKLAVVMQGKSTHWVVKGFLKSDPSTACNKPTPETHPALTKKINVLCSLLVKQKQKEQKKKEKLSGQWISPQMNAATQQTTPKLPQAPTQTTPKVAQILPMRRLAPAQPSTQTHSTTRPQHLLNPTITQNPVLSAQLQQPQQPIPPTPTTPDIQAHTTLEGMQNPLKHAEVNEPSKKVVAKQTARKRKMVSTAQSGNSMKMDVYSKMNSNIEFRNVTQSDLDEIFLPELHKLDHKWLVLDLHNDFSHIFVPEFRDLVSLDRIQKVINFARQKSKIVKMQFFQNAPFDAFVTPKSGRKIFFGPLTMEMKSPTLILLQSVDGQMMLRELYQLQHNIVKKPEEKTKAFWLIHLKGKTHFEINSNAKYEKTSTTENLVPISYSDNNKNKTCVDNELLTATTNISTNEEVKNKDEYNHDDGNDDDDEDCMIIDDTMENADNSPTTSTGSYNLSINPSNNETLLKVVPQTNALSSPHVMQSLKITKTNNMDASTFGPHTQSLLKVPNTNTIIKPLNPLDTTMPVFINVPPISTTNNPLPILTLPPNTIITGINPNHTSADVMPAPVINLPSTAVVTGVQSAPPEVPYSSTIYITPSSSAGSLGTTAATVTTASSTSSVAFNISNSLESQQISTNELKSAKSNKATNIMKQTLETGAIKRRRISLFCPNKYDKVSENLAVDAVIRKILPDNAQEIQINPTSAMRDEQNMPPFTRPEVVATVGSTKISKIPSSELKTIVTSTKAATIASTSSAQPKTPIVFDVNFMDDGDEPTASILIKPNTSKTSAATETKDSLAGTKNSIAKTVNARTTVTNTNTSLLKGQIMTATIGGNINSNTSAVYKNVKLPTQTVNTPAANSDMYPNQTARTKLINSILNTKQQQQQSNIVPKFSTPRSVAPKVSTPSSNVATSSLANITTTTTTVNPFPFRRSSVSVKVLNSTNAVTMQTPKPITTSATVSLNPTSPTLTVQQVQDILNKSSNNTPTSSPAASPITSMPVSIMPTIKATITPAKMTAISNTSTTTPTSSGVLTNSLTSEAATTEATTSNAESSTLTISKVQSFGSTQKSPNINDKNLNTPIVINDVNEPQQIQTPPPHIQYGYIVSASYVNQKFVAKRVAEEFYVKVPSVGILKLQGLTAVNNYLNKHISKKDTQNSTAVWQFVAASKAVQMQNHQKSLLVRKIKNPNAVAAGSTKNKNTTISDSSLDEPILIDD